MKKYLVLAVLAFALAGVGYGVAASSSSATPFCENVLVTQPDPNSAFVGVGEVLTAGSDGTACTGTITGYQWRRDGVNISGATSSSYTTASADTGHAITLYETGTVENQVSINSITVIGASLFADDFNGAANSEPSSTLWNFPGGTISGVTYSGDTTYMGETGTGSLEVQAVNNSGTWNSSRLSSKSTIPANTDYYIEARVKDVCYNNIGADFSAPYEYSGSTPNDNLEIDLNERWTGEGTPQWYDYKHQFAVHHWNTANEWHTWRSNSDTGDSYGHGHKETTQLCGNFHTYGAKVTATQIQFYFDGTQEFTINKSDCAFKDPDGSGSTNNAGGDPADDGTFCTGGGDSDADSDGITNFDTHAQTVAAAILAHIDNSCPTDESEGTSDSDDTCASDSDTAANDASNDNDGADGIYGSGPVQMYIDYIHVYSLS